MRILTGFSYMGDLLIDFSPPPLLAPRHRETLFRMALAVFKREQKLQTTRSVLRYFEIVYCGSNVVLLTFRACANCQRYLKVEEVVFLARIFDSLAQVARALGAISKGRIRTTNRENACRPSSTYRRGMPNGTKQEWRN